MKYKERRFWKLLQTELVEVKYIDPCQTGSMTREQIKEHGKSILTARGRLDFEDEDYVYLVAHEDENYYTEEEDTTAVVFGILKQNVVEVTRFNEFERYVLEED